MDCPVAPSHSLRAGLDIRKQTIEVVFAGSSESSLRRMFGRATEPVCNWTPIEPFERPGCRVGEELGLGKAAPLDTPKNALRRLQKDELVVKLEYGHYQIQDKGLVEWLRQLELEE